MEGLGRLRRGSVRPMGCRDVSQDREAAPAGVVSKQTFLSGTFVWVLQGMVRFNKATRMGRLQQILKNKAHCEICRDEDASVEYCQKVSGFSASFSAL